MTVTLETDNPFEGEIALSLSGGGGRAVGFHLGTLAYLNHVGLLRHLSILSTVSGGTLVGSGYALSLKRQTPFTEFFRDMYRFLESNVILNAVLEELEAARRPPSGRRTVVTALANVFNDVFFKDVKFGVFWEPPKIHLKDIIFNATEFKTGNAFCFQKSDTRCRIGSKKIWITEDHAKQIRMADVMTASCCIPGGLEPLFFPGDFHWPGSDGGRSFYQQVQKALTERFGVDAVALMDGGVYDNQGFTSILEALGRRPGSGKHPEVREQQEDRQLQRESASFKGSHLLDLIAGNPDNAGVDVSPQATAPAGIQERDASTAAPHENLGLLIISDTPLQNDPLYPARDAAPPRGLTLRGLQTVSSIVFVFVVLSFFSVAYRWKTSDQHQSWFNDLLEYGIPVVLTFLVAYGIRWSRREVKRVLRAVPEVSPVAGKGGAASIARRALLSLTLGEFMDMLSLRLSSLYAMSNDIFMNRIRELGYALVKSYPDLKNKVISNEIFDLLEPGEWKDLPDWLAPTPQMTGVIVKDAAHMGTKLWFDPPDPTKRSQLDVLLACGCATICFSLLAHLWRRHPREETVSPGDTRERFTEPLIEDLFSSAQRDWEAMREDAYVLVDRWKTSD